MEKKLAYLAIVLTFVLGTFVGFVLHRPKAGTTVSDLPHIDTLWIHDTLRIDAPAPKTVRIHDTIYVAVHDTTVIHRNDSTIIQLPRLESIYQGDGWKAWVTGYQASLDSIHIQQSTMVVNRPVYKTVTQKTRWGLGIQAGATYLPNSGVTPYVGVGISYNILAF